MALYKVVVGTTLDGRNHGTDNATRVVCCLSRVANTWVDTPRPCQLRTFDQASVMVEYTYEEAVALLESNLANALEKKVGGHSHVGLRSFSLLFICSSKEPYVAERLHSAGRFDAYRCYGLFSCSVVARRFFFSLV